MLSPTSLLCLSAPEILLLLIVGSKVKHHADHHPNTVYHCPRRGQESGGEWRVGEVSGGEVWEWRGGEGEERRGEWRGGEWWVGIGSGGE